MAYYRPPAKYRWHAGFVAWLLHRITGLLLILYLFIHEWVIASLQSPASFNSTMAFLATPLFKLSEIALWAVVAYHAVNGIRVILVNFSKAGERTNYNTNVWVFWIIAAILFVVGAIPMSVGLF